MCLAVPMRVAEIDGLNARCEAKGIWRDVSLFLLQHETVEPGDHVTVHGGYAVQKVTEAEALDTWKLFDEMLEEEALRAAGSR